MENEQQLHAVSVVIKNVMAIKEAEIRFGTPKNGEGQMIVFQGENGRGKTSLLRALLAVGASDHEPRLIRDGEEKSEIRLMRSDGVEFTRTVTRQEKKLVVDVPDDGVPISRLETYIKEQMGVGYALNPLSFLCINGESPDAKKRLSRLAYLMQVLGVSFKREAVSLAMDGAERNIPDGMPKAVNGMYDLAAVNKLIRDLTAARGPLGSKRDAHGEAAEVFRKTLAKEDQEGLRDWRAERLDIESRKSGIVEKQSFNTGVIQKDFAAFSGTWATNFSKAEGLVRNEYESLVAIVRAGTAVEPDQLRPLFESLNAVAELKENRNKEEVDVQKKLADLKEAVSVALQAIAGELSATDAGLESQISVENIRRQMVHSQGLAAEVAVTWNVVDSAIKALDGLKKLGLKALPETLDGVVIGDDDDIYYEGRQFDRHNKAEQFMLMLKIAAIGVGKLKWIIADEVEHLGPAMMKQLKAAVVASGLTFILARVDSEEEVRKTGGALRSDPPSVLTLKK